MARHWYITSSCDNGRVIATAETKHEGGDYEVLDSSALLALLRLHFPIPRHRLTTAPKKPIGLPAKESRIGLLVHFTNIFPLRSVV